MVRLTYDQYEEKCDQMEKLFGRFPTKPYFPTEEEINTMASNIHKFYDFLVYLATTNPLPITEEEVKSMKLINKIIGSSTEFVE